MEETVLDSGLQEESKSEVQWAGFWIRVVASFVDFFALVPLVVLNLANLYFLKNLGLQIAISILMLLYKPLMEYKYGATLGKMAVKIKVVNYDFNGLTLLQAILRYSPWLVGSVVSFYSMAILFGSEEFISAIGWTDAAMVQAEIVPKGMSYINSIIVIGSCIIVAFHSKKQGLHDLIARTYCIYK